jgi:hypothetical protein
MYWWAANEPNDPNYIVLKELAEREGFAPAVPIDNTQLVDS